MSDSMEAKLRARFSGGGSQPEPVPPPSGTTENDTAGGESGKDDTTSSSASENGTRKQPTTKRAPRTTGGGRGPRPTQRPAKNVQESALPTDAEDEAHSSAGGDVVLSPYETSVELADRDAGAVYTTVRRKRGIEEPTKPLYAQVPISLKVGLELLASQEDSTMRDELIEALRAHFAAKGYSPPDWRDLTFGPGWRQLLG